MANGNAPVLTSDALLNQWQGHRRLTRRMIEAFPDQGYVYLRTLGIEPPPFYER
jgi:uncharacterized damage-inducible protein DinB